MSRQTAVVVLCLLRWVDLIGISDADDSELHGSIMQLSTSNGK